MESSVQFLNLYYDIYVEIFSFFEPKDFLNLACTCQFFKKIFSQGEFWKAYTAKLGSRAIVIPTNLQVDSSLYFEFVKSSVKHFHTNAKKITNQDSEEAFEFLQALTPVEASSTDFCQSIEKVLSDQDSSFWSSFGSASQESVDSLTFLFKENFVVPFSVTVTFFTAAGFYQGGTLEFPSKSLQVQFSFDGINWEYESDIVQVNSKHQVEIKLLGKVGLARYMKVNFIGKTVLQPTDDLYYVAVECVECYGYSLDKDDKENSVFNQRLLDYYIAWHKEQNKKEIGHQILDYYNTKTFSPQDYSEAVKVLETGDNEAIWALFEKTKYLSTLDQFYIDIFKKAKTFAIFYFKKIIQEKKRRAFVENESLLLFLLYLDANQNQSTAYHQIGHFLADHYSCPELGTIQYLQMSTGLLSNIAKITGIGDSRSIDFLKDKRKIVFDYPIDYPEQTASIVLLNYIIMSGMFTAQNQAHNKAS